MTQTRTPTGVSLLVTPAQLTGDNHPAFEEIKEIVERKDDLADLCGYMIGTRPWLVQVDHHQRGSYISTSGLQDRHGFELSITNVPSIFEQEACRVLNRLCLYLEDHPTKTFTSGEIVDLTPGTALLLIDDDGSCMRVVPLP